MMEDFVVPPVRKGGGPPGLVNEGRTCFINAALQCLATTKLKDFFCNKSFEEKLDNSGPLVKCTADVMRELANSKKSVSPTSFVKTVIHLWDGYEGNTHEDSWEFLSFLFNCLHKHLQEKTRGVRGPPGEEEMGMSMLERMKTLWQQRTMHSVMSFLFTVQLVTLVTCSGTTCRYSSVSVEDNFLNLDVTGTSANLSDCLQDFKRELLDAPCSACSGKGFVIKERKLGRLPPYLIVQLKRFERLVDDTERKKDDLIEFGLDLDVTDFVVEDSPTNLKYELVGVLNHFGTLDEGHYTAFCKRDSRWYTFDDGQVAILASRKIVSRSAYMLWFELKDVERSFEGGFEDVYGEGNNIFEDPLDVPPPNFQAEPENTVLEPRMNPPDSVMSVPHSPVAVFETSDAGNVNSSEVSRICDHPPFGLNVQDPVLTVADVPSPYITVENIHDKNVKELKEWLKFRGCHQGGSKEQLVKRIQDHIKQKKGDRIDPKADGGLWYRRKKQKSVHESGEGDVPIPILPAGTNVWKSFPSVHLPEKFTKEQMEEYFQRLPNVIFSPETGVITAPDTDKPDLLSALESDEELRGLSEEEDDPNEVETPSVPSSSHDFFLLVKRAVINAIPRGERYKRAGHVLGVMDCSRGDHYFVKGQVQASMEPALRLPTCTISKLDGKICNATCSCKAKALNRCGHISALLHLVLDHIKISGTEENNFKSYKNRTMVIHA